MKRISIILFALLSVMALQAQVIVDVKIDSMRIFVGEQTAITLSVTCDSNQNPELPTFDSSIKKCAESATLDGSRHPRHYYLTPGVEVVDMDAPSTVSLNGGKRKQINQRYLITSFDSATYYLPPMQVLVDTTVYESEPLALQVYSMPVDTTHYEIFAGINDIEDQPLEWQDWKQTTYSALSIILLALLIALAVWWLMKGNPVIPLMRRKPKLPPHQVAMAQITKIKEERTWATEDSKDYYTQLTDTLRTYIQDRYGFQAMDMTTSEIIDRLVQENDPEALKELTDLFETADLVKFAKYTTPINENDAHLLTAINYINQTKVEVDPNAQPKEPLYTAEQRRTIGVKWALRISVVLMSAGIIAILVFMIIRLIDLLS